MTQQPSLLAVTQLQLSPTDTASCGQYSVTARNPTSGGGGQEEGVGLTARLPGAAV